MTARGWGNLVKTLVITLAPIYVSVLIFIYFGFKIESILASVLFVQIYVFIVQAEAMFRQAEWIRAAYDAVFVVSADVRKVATTVIVKNSGNKPAYNFFVGFGDETTAKRLEYARISTGAELGERDAHMLSGGSIHQFHVPIPEEEFRKHRILLNIGYDNVLGHSRDVRAASFENSEEFLILPYEQRPGFLTRAYEDLMLFTRLYRYRKWATKGRRKK